MKKHELLFVVRIRGRVNYTRYKLHVLYADFMQPISLKDLDVHSFTASARCIIFTRDKVSFLHACSAPFATRSLFTVLSNSVRLILIKFPLLI